MVVNLKTRVGRTEQISRHYLALRRMLWRHFSAEEPWVLEWIRIPSDACGRAKTIWNFWIRNEKVADSKISGYVWTGPKWSIYNSTSACCNFDFDTDYWIICFTCIHVVSIVNCTQFNLKNAKMLELRLNATSRQSQKLVPSKKNQSFTIAKISYQNTKNGLPKNVVPHSE